MDGANAYKWINTTAGLNATQIANPVAIPSNSTVYTVVGYDAYQCYTDTLQVNVIVRPLPTVYAGVDIEAVYGSANQLSPVASSDVVRWNWTPSDFLSCTNCPSPVSKPYSPVEYVVSVYNSYNCMAQDTISIKATCTEGGVYIPSAFTPNQDGKNDLFTINGSGIGIIKSLRVYNRWGEIIFEKKNFYPNDNSSAWNGKYKGVDADAGTYVYFAEMECNAGEMFTRKGTVTLVR
jgi:gliding motility-associated-like protein